MNTTKLWADNRNLVAEGTLASLLWQLLGGLSRLQEAPTPLKAAPVWGAKVFSPGAGLGRGHGLLSHSSCKQPIVISSFPDMGGWQDAECVGAESHQFPQQASSRISSDAFVQIITKLVCWFLCTASTEQPAPVNS